jgi:hypothetical protein
MIKDSKTRQKYSSSAFRGQIFCDNDGMPTSLSLTELESAINFWRQRSPSIGEELRLCAEASSLATPYALMIIERRKQLDTAELSERAQAAIAAWYAAQVKVG